MRLFKPTRLILALAAVAAAAAMSVPQSSGSAYACAFGNSLYGPDNYCAHIYGNGLHVDRVTGYFSGSSLVRNWYITAEFFDQNSKWYQTYNGKLHKDTTSAGGDEIKINANKKAGFVCSTLHYQGLNTAFKWVDRKMSLCRGIHA